MKLNPRRKMLILAWAMNFFAMCSSYYMVTTNELITEANPIAAYFFSIQQPLLYHIAGWLFIFVLYGIFYERFLEKNKNFKFKIKPYVPFYILLIIFFLDFLNDLILFLIVKGII